MKKIETKKNFLTDEEITSRDNIGKYKVSNQILELLKKPQTVSDLKEKIKVSSIGTIAYHLKNLEEKGVILKEKQTKVRGQPTYYFLSSYKRHGLNNWFELERKFQEEETKIKVNILKELLEKPMNAYSLEKKHDPTLEDDRVFSFIFDPNKYIELIAKITPQGKKFLKENADD